MPDWWKLGDCLEHKRRIALFFNKATGRKAQKRRKGNSPADPDIAKRDKTHNDDTSIKVNLEIPPERPLLTHAFVTLSPVRARNHALCTLLVEINNERGVKKPSDHLRWRPGS